MEALESNIRRYEDNFGPIVPADIPPSVGFIQ
jgi:hypothetical protein